MQQFIKSMKVITFLSLIFLLTGCQKYHALKSNPEDQLAISIMTTRNGEKEGTFESDIYLFDMKTQKTKKIAAVPYTSQYPLSVYDPQKKLLYYSSRLKGTHEDEVFVYDCRTKKTRQLTDWCNVLNYMFIKENKLFLAAMDTEKRIITSYWCDPETGKPTDLTWDHDLFVDYATYNPLTNDLYCNLYSDKESYKRLNEPENGIRQRFYQINTDGSFRLITEEKRKIIGSLVANSKKMLYISKNTSMPNVPEMKGLKEQIIEVVSYDFQSKKKTVLSENDKSLYQMGFIYLDRKGTTLYGLKKGLGLGDPDKLVSYDLKNHTEKILFRYPGTEGAINNACVVKK